MSVQVADTLFSLTHSLVTQQNAFALDVMKFKLGSIFHAGKLTPIDVTEPTADGYGTDGYSASLVVASNACRAFYIAHIASYTDGVLVFGAHNVADATNVLVAPVATDLASSETLLNDIKAKFSPHLARTACHGGNQDSTNTISSADATDEASALALAIELIADLNAHSNAAMLSKQIDVIAP